MKISDGIGCLWQRWKAWAATALAVTTFVGQATLASALVWEEVPTKEEMAREANLSFRGIVVDVSYGDAANVSGQSLPYTTTTFRVLRGYRGAKSDEMVEITQMGGPRADVPNRYVEIAGSAHFEVGDEVIVFSNDETQPFFGALFGDHGVLRVVESERNERLVTSSDGHVLVDTGGRVAVDGDRRCVAERNDRRKCVDTTHPSAREHGGEQPSPRSRAMRASEFDAHIEEAVRGRRAPPRAERVRGNHTRFEERLRDANRRINTKRADRANRP